MEKHYVCTGECSGVSAKPMVCGASDCSKYEKPLTSCNCEDGIHMPAFAEIDSEKEAGEVGPAEEKDEEEAVEEEQ